MGEVEQTRIDKGGAAALPTLAELVDNHVRTRFANNKSAMGRAINASPQWVDRIIRGVVRRPDDGETLDNLIRELGMTRAEYLVIVGQITQDDLDALDAEVWTAEQRRLAEYAGQMAPENRKVLLDLAEVLAGKQGR